MLHRLRLRPRVAYAASMKQCGLIHIDADTDTRRRPSHWVGRAWYGISQRENRVFSPSENPLSIQFVSNYPCERKLKLRIRLWIALQVDITSIHRQSEGSLCFKLENFSGCLETKTKYTQEVCILVVDSLIFLN